MNDRTAQVLFFEGETESQQVLVDTLIRAFTLYEAARLANVIYGSAQNLLEREEVLARQFPKGQRKIWLLLPPAVVQLSAKLIKQESSNLLGLPQLAQALGRTRDQLRYLMLYPKEEPLLKADVMTSRGKLKYPFFKIERLEEIRQLVKSAVMPGIRAVSIRPSVRATKRRPMNEQFEWGAANCYQAHPLLQAQAAFGPDQQYQAIFWLWSHQEELEGRSLSYLLGALEQGGKIPPGVLMSWQMAAGAADYALDVEKRKEITGAIGSAWDQADIDEKQKILSRPALIRRRLQISLNKLDGSGPLSVMYRSQVLQASMQLYGNTLVSALAAESHLRGPAFPSVRVHIVAFRASDIHDRITFLIKTRRFPETLALLDWAEKLFPDKISLPNRHVRLLIRMRHFEESMELAESTHLRLNRLRETSGFLVSAYLHGGRAIDAISVIDKALEKEETTEGPRQYPYCIGKPALFYVWASILKSSPRPRLCWKLNRTLDRIARGILASALLRSGDIMGCLEIVQETIRLQNTGILEEAPVAYNLLALANIAAGHSSEAVTISRKTVEGYPENFYGYRVLAKALFKSGKPSAAIQVLEKAQNKFPQVYIFYILLIRSLLQHGRFREARRIFEISRLYFPAAKILWNLLIPETKRQKWSLKTKWSLKRKPFLRMTRRIWKLSFRRRIIILIKSSGAKASYLLSLSAVIKVLECGRRP